MTRPSTPRTLASAATSNGALHEANLLDADGRHDDAVNALARATQLGDVEAMTALGARLVTGDRAPALPRQGAGLLIDATHRGGREAPALLAVLAATGIACERSWPQAIELLMLSAERGSTHAQGQLRALCVDDDARRDDTGNGSVWRRLGRGIDLTSWMSAPPETVLHDSPAIRAFENFVTGPVCDWIIERSSDRLGPALVYDPVSGENIKDVHRTNRAASFDLMQTDLVQLLVQHRMWACCGVPLRNMETMSVLHYAVGEQITNHFDFVDPKTPNYERVIAEQGQRIVTFLVYLNDDYEGGETEFPRLGVSHKGRRGEGLYFINALENRQPDLRMVHAGRPPIRGEKWIVSQFMRDREVLRIGHDGPAQNSRGPG